MTDTAAPSTDKRTPQEESRISNALALAADQETLQAAQRVVSSDPPLGADAQPSLAPSPGIETVAAGVEAPPAGIAAAVSGDAAQEVIESTKQPFDIEKTVLIEHPTQGAAVEREQPIPPAEAEPLKDLATIAPVLAEVQARVDATALAASFGKAAETAGDSSGTAAEEEHDDEIDMEHPLVTIAKIRQKLSAHGEEVLKLVQPELEYLIHLCS